MARKTKAQQRQSRHYRLRKSVKGTADCPRLCVYRSLQHTYAQLIDDTNGHVLVSANTQATELREGANANAAAAKRVGAALAERAKAAGVEQVVFDRGGWQYHGRIRALADAAREAGLRF